jgi:hypothetical protein
MGKLRKTERLGHEGCDLQQLAAGFSEEFQIGGNDNDGKGPVSSAQPQNQFCAANSGHSIVRDKQVVRASLERYPGVLSVLRGGDLIASLLKMLRKANAQTGTVLGIQDAGPAEAAGFATRCVTFNLHSLVHDFSSVRRFRCVG